MLYFNPKPDFQILSKYILFPNPIEVMEQQSHDGYDIIIDRYYTDEQVYAIKQGFKNILTKHNLVDHYDNLLFLCLGKVQEIDAVIDELYFQYSQKKRTKELAGFLLNYINSYDNQLNGLSLKTFTGTGKVSDINLTKLIINTFIKAIESGQLPIADYEYNIRELLFDKTDKGLKLNKEKLDVQASKTVISPTRNIRALHAGFCFYIYEYLVNETNIKPDPSVRFSDAQLMFYYDVLVLFGFIKPDEVDSDEKDFMRAILANRIKTLNPHLQGNKAN